MHEGFDSGFGGRGGEKIGEEKPVKKPTSNTIRWPLAKGSKNHETRRREENPSLKKGKAFNILIRVPNWLGDSMMSTAAVSAVKKMFPKSKITILAKTVFRDFWESFPGVDQVIVLEAGLGGFWRNVSKLKAGSFDVAVILPTSFSAAFLPFVAEIPKRIGWGGEGRDLFLTRVVPHSNPRQKHLVLEYLNLVRQGLDGSLGGMKRVKLECEITPEAERGLRTVWADTGVPEKRGYIALAPGATYGAAKRWPLPYWQELISQLLKERSESFLILGGLEEEAYLKPLLEGRTSAEASRLHLLAGRTTPSILAAMLSRCKLLVTNDTGPMHVAAAVGTPTVALFGSTSPTWTRPFGTGHEVIYKHLECSPCFQKTCPIGYKCLHAISVDEVYREVQKKLAKPGKIQPEKIPQELIQ
jgi:heptosyltransferase II